MKLVADTATRVSQNTSSAVNRRIAEETRRRLATIGRDRDLVRARLAELDREWDIERAIEVNAASLALTGAVLGLTVHKAFLALPIAVTAFLLQHGVQGWCPPVPLLRRMGFRTQREIEDERHQLLSRTSTARPGRAPKRARGATARAALKVRTATQAG